MKNFARPRRGIGTVGPKRPTPPKGRTQYGCGGSK